MAKKIFQKIADILLRPFREHFLFFLVLCALTVSGHSLGYFNGNGEMNLNATIATAMHCIGISYIATLIVGIAQPKIVRQILQTAFILFAAFDFALNFYCSLYLHYLFDSDIARLILETDPNEDDFSYCRCFSAFILPLVALQTKQLEIESWQKGLLVSAGSGMHLFLRESESLGSMEIWSHRAHLSINST